MPDDRDLARYFRTDMPVPGRAREPYMKQQVLDRIMAVWEAFPEMRLGQLISNAIGDDSRLYGMEDFPLAQKAEEFRERHA